MAIALTSCTALRAVGPFVGPQHRAPRTRAGERLGREVGSLDGQADRRRRRWRRVSSASLRLLDRRRGSRPAPSCSPRRPDPGPDSTGVRDSGAVAGQNVRRGVVRACVRAAIGVALLAVAVDVGVAVVRAVRSRPRVVERGTGRAVDEPRPFAESAPDRARLDHGDRAPACCAARPLRSRGRWNGSRSLTVRRWISRRRPTTSTGSSPRTPSTSVSSTVIPTSSRRSTSCSPGRSDPVRGRSPTPTTRRWR